RPWCAPSFARSPTWSVLPFGRDRRAGKIAGRKHCRARALCRDAARNSAAFRGRCSRAARRRRERFRELVPTPFPYSKPAKVKCTPYLSNCSRKNKLRPKADLDRLAGLERFADLNPQQRIRFAQSEKRVRFLPADRREISVSEFSAQIMGAVAIVCQITNQLCRQLHNIDVVRAHHFQNGRPNKLQKRDKRR